MTILETLKTEFHDAFPRLASGKYVHFLLLRHSQSFPVFQTDGVLNTARTQAGLDAQETISRLVMFKRKQTTPERLAGREILRSLDLTSADANADNFCDYNGENSCKQCPDCIIYGFAIGDSGSERSKVYSDSAFSLSAYERSHRSFTFNAPFEGGTMSEKGVMRSAINEQDHILPEITFPTVETLRDPTSEGFLYVLGNLLRTRRYGAQESRTGTMKNHLLGIVLCDGEIFSNLHFTQALYDAIEGKIDTPIAELKTQAGEVVRQLLEEELVRKTQMVFGTQLEELLAEVRAIYQDESQLQSTLSTLYQQTQTYAATYGATSGKGKKNKGKKK
ncbi:type I-D CRISPR-associated protein Cas7/Csc2 [Oscillatoriales cyanobacterium LEGE 11467]|uniref:Type I-D CRISPR-associated protein Cas7/Csc2 n=1 Tax=Zarconia navalis LEGE 11467 TaxID=1828826 RepID=A0A928ZA57_9CYAN|nr:type I-D CRISPR-associated protein Cas7/Csc2 [Zarconia navalis]MBE9041411.1 type I-D CRISPR-associated protein Cas7/Csc2 [Zarconia navalis LEGE 11467]